MQEKMPKEYEHPEIKKTEEGIEMQRTITEAELLKGGANYVVIHEGEKREKRLELAEQQIEAAKHEMMQSLKAQAELKEFLSEIGLESLEGLPTYRIQENISASEVEEDVGVQNALKESDYHGYGAVCCVFGLGGEQARQSILNILYKKFPDLKSLNDFIVETNDAGTFIVQGEKITRVPQEVRKLVSPGWRW